MHPQHLFDGAYHQVLSGQVIPAFRLLGKPLSDLYAQYQDEDRLQDLVSVARAHPLFELTQQDCREIEDSLIFNDAFQGEFIGLDADAQSCAEVIATYANSKVRALYGNAEVATQMRSR